MFIFRQQIKLNSRCCCRQVTKGSDLCHGVWGLRLLGPDGRVRRQRDAGGCVTGRLRPLDAHGGRRRVNCQPWTPERKCYCVKSAKGRFDKSED